MGPATVDTGNATLAYDALSGWNVSIGVNESSGTDLEAGDADTGATIADATVDGDGTPALSLPAGAHRVAFAEADAGGGGGGGGSGGAGPSGTPSIVVDDVTVEPDALTPGESTTVSVVLANAGDGGGAREVTLFVDDGAVDATNVFVPADGTRTLTFTPSFDAPGEYAIRADETDGGSVTVSAPRDGEPSTPTGEPTPVGTDGSSGAATATDPPASPDDGGGQPPAIAGGDPTLVLGLVVAAGLVVGLGLWARGQR